MSEEQQQEQQQQQQHQQQHQRQQMQIQQQQQHNNNKTLKDNASTTASTNSNTNPTRKTNINEMRNQEFVSRLMAATPPYLYSAPVGPNNFFFSDMLRSLVQARNNENARNLQLQQTVLARRPRKRTWSQHRPFYEQFRERKETEEKQLQQQHHQQHQQLNSSNTIEKPLELTNKTVIHLANKYRKSSEDQLKLAEQKQLLKCATDLPQTVAAAAAHSETCSSSSGGAVDSVLHDTPPAASLPPQDLVLPPPPPVWYPSLYPPYGIDPLHFFIDLRVSGHIYDRKKDNSSPLAANADNASPQSEHEKVETLHGIGLTNKHRQGSAFSVPVPRTNELQKTTTTTNTPDAINLTAAATKFENYAKYYDFGESKENQPFSKTASANYMLQHLPRLYSHFAAHAGAPDTNLLNGSTADNDNKSECDADSDGRASTDDCPDSNGNRDRDIDVEIIDSIKYRTDGESSRCSSVDDASITQID